MMARLPMRKPKAKSEKLEQLSLGGELWESGDLGESIDHMRIASTEEDNALDDAIGLQLISIRLPKTLIEQLKSFGRMEGIGYQPLIRSVLTDFARSNQHRLEELPLPTTREEILEMMKELTELRSAVQNIKTKAKGTHKKKKQPKSGKVRKKS